MSVVTIERVTIAAMVLLVSLAVALLTADDLAQRQRLFVCAREKAEWRAQSLATEQKYAPYLRLHMLVTDDGKSARPMTGKQFTEANPFACACSSVNLADLESRFCKDAVAQKAKRR